MLAYTVRRLLALIPTLFFASVIVFVSVRLIPGSVIELMLATNPLAADKDRAAIEAALGLDKPMYTQYLAWTADALRGDLGRSLWQDTPVMHEILARLPVTLELTYYGMLISIVRALPAGVYSAIRQGTAGDYVTRSISNLLLAVPGFWLATLVMVFPSIGWGWSPKLAYVPFLLPRSPAPLHEGAARGGANPGPGPRGFAPAAGDRQRGAERAQPAARLPVPSTLPDRGGALQR